MQEHTGPSVQVRYLTEPWAEEALKRVESDARIQEAIDGIELSILSIILGAPEGAYGFVYVAFDQAGLADYRVGHDFNTVTEGIPKPTFVVSGDYGVFADVQRGKISERRALLTGKLHLTGGLVKALRHLRALETVTAVLAEIQCEV